MKPEFTKLWKSYPDEQRPCGSQGENQCAIRMSIALNGEGTLKINEYTYSEPRCEHQHARGAESLANHIWKKVGRPKIFKDGNQARKDLLGASGIIFFKNCFVRPGETVKDGDHIDLWRLGKMKGPYDLFGQSAQVWFWAL